MAMEHRWGRRVAVDVNATLFARHCGRLRGRLRDISSGGAFIQIPARLTPNTRVELVFTAGHAAATKIHRFETVVSRSTDGGVGLMFLQFDPQSLSSLLQRLEGTATHRRRSAHVVAEIQGPTTKEA